MESGQRYYIFILSAGEVQVINVEMDQVEVFFFVEHALDQRHMVRQWVDTSRSQAERLLAYRHQTGFG